METAEQLKELVRERYGAIALTSGIADVVVSNCVLNLVPDKAGVFGEIYRVLKPGDHFSISDIVLVGILPPEIRDAAEMYVGCVAGAIQKSEYLGLIESAGFKNIAIQKEKPIVGMGPGIVSVTIYAEKFIDDSTIDR